MWLYKAYTTTRGLMMAVFDLVFMLQIFEWVAMAHVISL